MKRLERIVVVLWVGLATAVLFVVSYGRWCDAVVDVGSEWIFADTLARGGLLYRDVVYWFGPFTPYFEAAFFRALGSSFQTLIVAGVVGAAAAMAALALALRRVTTRFDAFLWTAAAIPALVFMPNSGGAILAMGHRMWHAATLTLLAGALAARPSFGRDRRRTILAGFLAGLAGLCRLEWGLAAVAAIAAGLCVRRRRSDPAPFLPAVLAAGTAFATWGASVGFFVWRAGAKAVIGRGQILLVGVSAETREFLWRFSRLPDWPRGLLALVGSAGLWLGVFLALDLATGPRGDGERLRRRLFALAACLLAIVAARVAGAPPGSALFSAAPLACAVAAAAGALGRAGRRSRAFVAFGTIGLLMSFRRPLDIRDLGYVAPPLLFAAVCAAGLFRRASLAQSARDGRRRLARTLTLSTAVLASALFVWRIDGYASDARVPIRGTARALSASPAFAREIEGLAGAIRAHTAPGDGLVVIPEGAVLNFLSGRHNPIRNKLLIPGYLTDANEAGVVAELDWARPASIVTWRGPSGEYGREVFGEDYARALLRWIEEHYERTGFEGREKKVLPGETTLWIRKGTAARPSL